MASYFGEINALSSRAVDDEEFENDLTYSFSIKAADDFAGPLSCKLLVFAVGEIAASFACCYLLPQNCRKLFDVKCTLNKDDSDSMRSYGGLVVQNLNVSRSASAFAASSDVVVCEISRQVPEDYNLELLDVVLSRVEAAQSLVLTSQHVSTYKATTSATPETPFLKALGTSSFAAAAISTATLRLQPPNYLTGFPAAVLSDFEVKRKQALCVVDFVDMDVLDSINVHGFRGVFSETLAVKLTPNSDAESKLLKYVKEHANQSNLYA